MKSRFTEEQIIGILKQQESGIPTAQVCRDRVPMKWVAHQPSDLL